MDENEALNNLLDAQSEAHLSNRAIAARGEVPQPCPVSDSCPTDMDFVQWQVAPNGNYRPAARTAPLVPAGVYRVGNDQYGIYLEGQRVIVDDIVELPDVATFRILRGMKTFWASKERYRQHGLIYKRGVLLWGPPGSGKSVTVQLLCRELIALNGIVLLCNNPDLIVMILAHIRKIEPGRPLIVVMEDVDEIISAYGERSILAMLDGESQVDNVVYVATTNYPERLGARIVNRPSRFDERIFVGMPSKDARLVYLSKATSNGAHLESAEIERWADDTDGLSVAHLRELVAAVLCLDQPYAEALARLRSMSERPKAVDGFKAPKFGLAAR